MSRSPGCRSIKILLVNVHSSWNAGDHLLTEEAVRLLEDQFPGASFTLAMDDPSSYSGPRTVLPSFTAWVHPTDKEHGTHPWRWLAFPALVWHALMAAIGCRLTGRPWYLGAPPLRRALLEAYFDADMVVSTAGGFLVTSGFVGISFLLALFTIYYGVMAGRPVYLLPQSLGPIRRKREAYLLRQVLSRTRMVLIRDAVSMDVWREWRVPRVRAYLVPDLALGRPPETCRADALALLRSHGAGEEQGRPWLGVTLMNWGTINRAFLRQDEYEEAVAAAIRDFVTGTGGQAFLFVQVHGPSFGQDDAVPARRVQQRLAGLGDRVVLVGQWVAPTVLRAAYGEMDLFLGTRLHSNLFALTEGVPVVAIGYQYKTRGIMRMLGLEEYVVEIDSIAAEALVPLVRKAWSENKELRAHIASELQRLREETAQAGTLIAQDYRRVRQAAGPGGEP